MQWVPCAAYTHDSSVTTARFGHSAVCISGTGSVWGTDLVVVFGGVSYSDHAESSLEHHAALADVTVFQVDADMWFAPQVSPASADSGLPEARAFHCAAAVDRRMYIFGGHVMSYDPVLNKKRRRFFNDLWCLDTDTWTWQCLSFGTAAGISGLGGLEVPSRRDMATLTRSGTSCLLLFGGRLESGRVAGDAWILDLDTLTWSQLRIPGPHPAPRKMHAAVYVTNRVVLFGGERDTGLLDDLWTLKGVDGSEAAKWTQIKLRPAPSGRFGHSMAACGSRLAVFGGCLDHSTLLSFSRTYVQCNELWVLDMATFSWHRVEAPEGATQVTGPDLDDPHLVPLLQQQAQESEGEEAERPVGHQLLALPLERMCHSLVPVGPEPASRLLLLGGRKRDGICEESWWLTMGPDNLTPVLTIPRPETLATALVAIRSQPSRPQRRNPQPLMGMAVPAAAMPASVSHVAPAPQPTTTTPTTAAPASAAPSTAPLLGNPSLLSNLLRKSPIPAQRAASGQQQQHGLHHPPPGQPADGGSVGGSVYGSPGGPPLDTVSAPALGTSGGSQRMPASKSAGSISPDPCTTAPAAGPSGPSIRISSLQPLQGPGAVGAGGGSVAAVGRERVAGAINRLTKQVSTLLRSDSAAGTSSTAPSPSPSPPAATGGIVARLLDGSASRGGTSPAPIPVQQSRQSPPSPSHRSARRTDSSKASPADEPAGPSGAASSLPPELRGQWDRLREALGLQPPGPPPSFRPPSPELLELGQALTALGGKLAEEDAAAATDPGRPSASTSGAAVAAAHVTARDAITLARRQLLAGPLEQLTVLQLSVVLADCQALLKARSAAAWEAMEREAQYWATQQGPSGDGGGGAALMSELNRTALTYLVASNSHWLSGLRPGDLRLEDVPRLMISYAELVGGLGSRGADAAAAAAGGG